MKHITGLALGAVVFVLCFGAYLVGTQNARTIVEHVPGRVVTRTIHSKPKVEIRYRTRKAAAQHCNGATSPAQVNPDGSCKQPPVAANPAGLPAGVVVTYPAGYPDIACAGGQTYIQDNGPGTPYTLDTEDPQNSPCAS